MKLRLLHLLLVIVTTCGFSRATEVLRVTGDAEFPPYEYLNDAGEPRGFDIDLIKAVAAELGYKVDIQLTSWKDARARLVTGKADVLSGMFYSEERSETLRFSTPYLTIHYSQFLRRNTPYRPLSLMHGSPIVLIEDGIMHDELKKQEFSQIILVDSAIEALRKIEHGEARIFIGSKLQGLYLIRRNNFTHVRAAGPAMKARPYCMAVPKERQALLNNLNEALAMIKASGEYDRLWNRHFGHFSNTDNVPEYSHLASRTFPILVVLLGGAVLYILFILHKKQQQSKTLSRRLKDLEQADHDLTQSQQQYEFLANNIKEVFFIISLDTNSIYYLSPGFEQIWGYPVNRAYREPHRVLEVIPNAERNRLLQVLREKGAHGPLTFEVPYRRPVGAEGWLHVRSYPVCDAHGTPYRLTGFIEDFTEQKRAADRKEYMTEGLRQVVRLASELLQCSNLEVLYRRSVELMRENFGLERCGLFIEQGDHVCGTYGTDMHGQTTDEHEYIDPKWASWEADLKSHANDNRFWFRIDREHTQWEGHASKVVGQGWVVITPVFASDGKVLGVISNDKAISKADLNPDQQDLLAVFSLILGSLIERLRAESSMHQLRVDLEKARQMESIGLLAGGVAHDLNNILGPIVGYPELIKTMLAPDHPAQADLEQIKRSARQAASVIQDLLHMARRGHIVPVPVNPQVVVQHFVESPSFMDSCNLYPLVDFTLNMDEQLPSIMGTEHHVHQILLNLVNNAFEACAPNGAVKLTVSKADGPTLLMCVEDNGPGIAPEDQAHIFEPFYTRKQLGRSGSGLGLSVVYGIAQDLKASIEVRSEPGRGCWFTLRMEALDTKHAEDTQEAVEVHGTESILVVDDLAEQQNVAKRLLTSLGYTVHTASTIEQAVRKIKEHPCELVVMDMLLNDGENGLEAYKALLAVHPDLKCVVVSGFAEHEDLNQIQELGVHQFVNKPYNAATLSVALRAELDADA